MDAPPTVERVASLLGSAPRRRILEILLDGHPRSATELGIISGVAFNTASSHLTKLVEAELVTVERNGQHRFYRVTGPRVVDVIEALYELLPGQKRKRSRSLTAVEMARTCYDHLAGHLGASLTDAIVAKSHLRPEGKDFALSEGGESFFSGLGIDLGAVRRERRMFARRCLDWTDKRDHLGGALGAALTSHCFAAGWLKSGSSPRLVEVTPSGAAAFRSRFGVAFN